MNDDILYEIKSLENAISRYVFSNMKEEDKKFHPLSAMQVGIIEYLIKNQNKDIYQRDLEAIFKVRRSSISGVLQTMEKKGFIKKEVSKEDARKNKIILTDLVIEKQKEVLDNFKELEKKLTYNLDENDLEIFHKVINQMKKNIEKN